MKRFVFRLERVLQLRADAEQECARTLATAAQAELARRQERSAREADVERIGQQIAPTPGQTVQVGMLRALGLTATAAAAQLEQVEHSHEAAHKALDAERVKYSDAQVQRRVLEKLRERRHDAWSRDAARHEQAEQDEVARRNHGARQGAE